MSAVSNQYCSQTNTIKYQSIPHLTVVRMTVNWAYAIDCLSLCCWFSVRYGKIQHSSNKQDFREHLIHWTSALFSKTCILSYSTNTRHSPNICLILGQRLRRWPTLNQNCIHVYFLLLHWPRRRLRRPPHPWPHNPVALSLGSSHGWGSHDSSWACSHSSACLRPGSPWMSVEGTHRHTRSTESEIQPNH